MGATTRSQFVPVGGYSLEVGRSGSFAHYQQEAEHENASALATALDEEQDERPKPVAAIEEFQESADVVTGKVEQADQLLKAAADGQLLDLSNVTGEIDALLDLLGRLDRAGRFEEEFRLMRSLNGLLALAMRWLALIRSLRSLLSSAETAGDAAGQAFAHHEIGSLYLCAGRPKEAVKHLREADRFRLHGRFADLASQCATRHNLDSAERDLVLQMAGGTRPPTRLQRLFVLGGATAIAAASGAGIALAVHHAHGQALSAGTTQPTTSNSTSTSASTSTSTQTTTPTTTQTQTHAVPVPTGLSAVAVSPTEIDISWQDPPAISSYVIYRGSQKLTPVFGNETSYHDTDVAPSETYVYRVQALAPNGKASQKSRPKLASTPPSAPTNLVATESSTTPDEMDLTWTPPAGDTHVTGYVIYRVEYTGSAPDTDAVPDTPLATVGSVAGYPSLPNTPVATSGPFISYPDRKVIYTTTYGYIVKAVDAAGRSSEPSNLAWATEAGG